MAAALTMNLRRHVVATLRAECRSGGRRFCAGEATAGHRLRQLKATGNLEPKRHGGRFGSVLDGGEDLLLAMACEVKRDAEVAEVAERLKAERGLRVHVTTIW
ncbi:transposase [Parvularcula dongshanensis]|uniref:Transposase n=1 Tax=Parvularcula dongshanensis TaxID=1173995 RepID=A0A840I2U7_9PROT|nr:transposase [Parvularcula dongshanensis]